MNFGDAALQTPPAPNQLEVSLFGPGVGECVVVHLGEGRWMVVDSCLHDGAPIANRYLEALTVSPKSVVAVVATHWHDDHHLGIARAFKAFPQAEFLCSAALQTREFLTLAASARGHYDNASGLHELHGVLDELQARAGGRRATVGPRWVSAGMRVLQWPSTDGPLGTEVWALSPSAGEQTRAVQEIASLLPTVHSTKRRLVARRPNHAAVVLQVRRGEDLVLLGSDLEEEGVAATGWSAVVANHATVGGRSRVYKVAHHGSPTGHHEGIYSALTHRPIGIVTPFRSSGLPSAADVLRLKQHCDSVHLTASNEGSKVKARPPVVERMMGSMASNVRAELARMGMVRVRLGATHSIEHFGAATQR